jgi:hypothetical protein
MYEPSSHLTLGRGMPLAWQVMLAEAPYSISITDRLGEMNIGGMRRSNNLFSFLFYFVKRFFQINFDLFSEGLRYI